MNYLINMIRNNLFGFIWLVISFIGVMISKFINDTSAQAISGYLICLSLLTGYYGILYYALKKINVKIFISDKEKYRLSVLSLISILFILWGCNLNHTLYCWDSFIVWGSAINYSQQIFLNPFNVILDLYNSINNADYNSFLGSLMALPMHIIGSDFLSYVLIGWIMFFIPFGVIFSITINIIMEKIGWKKIPNSLSFLLIFLLPAISNQMFFGYMYISALLPGIVLLLIIININFEIINWKILSLIGLICIIVTIQNRTLTYMIIGYLVSAFFFELVVNIKENKRKYICNLFISAIYIVLFNITVLLIFFRGFFERSLFNNFSVAYSAYAWGMSITDRIISVIYYFGVIILVLFILGLVLGILEKKLKLYTIMLLIWIITSTVLINLILTMNGHQMYIIIIPLLIIIEISICYIYEKINSDKIRNILVSIFFISLFVNFLYAFSGTSNSNKYLGYVHHPLNGYNISTIKSIVNDLKNISENNSKIYFISSNGLINDDIFQKSNVPRTLVALPSLAITSHVDLRDGFYTSFLDSDIIVVADPIQTHLRPEDQQVIVILGNLMLTDNDISRHFELVKEYSLDKELGNKINENIIKIKVYKKIKPFNKKDITYIENLFDEKYQNYPELFHDRFEKYKKKF